MNYVVTSNHIHLLVFSGSDRLSIPRIMQLLAGRTGQEYNCRKSRKGVFWDDGYNATVIESGEHLRRCMIYIDMNMVRVGVAAHPGEWAWGGYLEIQNPPQPQRYGRIDRMLLSELIELADPQGLAAWQEDSVRMALEKDATAYRQRWAEWTESVAVGSHGFAVDMQAKPGLAGRRRKVEQTDAEDGWVLRDIVDPVFWTTG